MRQPPLFITAGPLYQWESPVAQAPALPSPPPRAEPRKRRKSGGPNARLRSQFEAFLRDKGWPYVCVDEAKQAIFGGADIEGFDYLVYSSTGANLLVLLVPPGPVGQEPLDSMREWESVFGKDFRTVFVSWTDAGWTCRALPDRDGRMEELNIEDLV
jgi:hypothetical protein